MNPGPMITDGEMLPTAWIIDKDHLCQSATDTDAAGTAGPSSAPKELMDRLALDTKAGVRFRMYDGDGELYYSGRIIALDENGAEQTFDTCGEEFFRPLLDFGTPDSGCTEIRYQRDGKWVEL